MRMLKQTLAKMVALFVLVPALGAQAAPTPHRLQTPFTGKDKCLDIINDGANNRPVLATCANVSGQIWTFEPLGIPGHFHLHAQFAGAGKCLDIINEAKRDTPIMAPCGNFSGQHWTLTQESGYIRMRNLFSGDGKCLDILNDGSDTLPRMRRCENVSGQMWHAPPYAPL